MAEHHSEKHRKHPEHPIHHEKPSDSQKEIKITLPTVKGLNATTVTTAAAVILLLFAVFQAYQGNILSREVGKMAAAAEEKNRAPEIELTAISAECAQCTPVEAALAAVKAAKVNVTKESILGQNDEHAKTLIRQYDIARLPTVVVKGEIDNVGLAGFTRSNDALIYTGGQPPYVDAATGQVKGVVTLTYVNATGCAICPDLLPVVEQLKATVKVGKVTVVGSDSSEGQKLIKDYEMARLPGLLLSNDVNEYAVSAQLAQVGTSKKGGVIALGANPPYLNVSTGKAYGVTQVILLNDSTCNACYDASLHLSVLKGSYQVYTDSIRTVDAASAEGRQLVSKYNITAVPTVVVTGEPAAYDALTAIWASVGSIESDGAYIFRNMEAIAGRPYKDLTTGNVNPNTPQQ